MDQATPLTSNRFADADGDRPGGGFDHHRCGVLLKEVEQPLRGLERALARVGKGNEPPALQAQGAPEVQRITRRFNVMV